MKQILEDKKRELISKSKNSYKGKQRLLKRLNVKVSPSVKTFNEIDMNVLFKNDILKMSIPIIGETDDYVVKLSFSGVIENIRKELGRIEPQAISFRIVYKALVKAFNDEDIYVRCNCPDAQYRFNYYQSKNNVIVGDRENRPSNITNPNDTLGSACKHVLCVLNNISYFNKIASVIVNYVNYAKVHLKDAYQKIIFPALYGEKYSNEAQDILDNNIEAANKYAREKNWFKKGNTFGYRFAKADLDDQIENNKEDNSQVDDVDDNEVE